MGVWELGTVPVYPLVQNTSGVMAGSAGWAEALPGAHRYFQGFYVY